MAKRYDSSIIVLYCTGMISISIFILEIVSSYDSQGDMADGDRPKNQLDTALSYCTAMHNSNTKMSTIWLCTRQTRDV